VSWDDTETVLVGDRRMRVRRRLPRRRRTGAWVAFGIVVVFIAGGVGAYLYLHRPQGLDSLDGPAVTASGGFQTKDNGDGIITVALEVRNTTDQQVTVVSARLVPPSGLTQIAVSVLQPGDENRNLNLADDLPQSTPVTLGTNGQQRNGIVAARFRIDCGALPPTAAPTGEQIFVTVRLGNDQREEELTPPVYDGVPWLTATARGACQRQSTPVGVQTPLPTL
jgi:hypothetical protein